MKGLKMMNILCLFGFHKNVMKFNYYPNINAEILEGFSIVVTCKRCKKRLVDHHMVWNKNTQVFEVKK